MVFATCCLSVTCSRERSPLSSETIKPPGQRRSVRTGEVMSFSFQETGMEGEGEAGTGGSALGRVGREGLGPGSIDGGIALEFGRSAHRGPRNSGSVHAIGQASA